MASSSPAPEAPNKPSLKALGKRKALTPNLSDDDLPLSKRATLSQPPSSSSTYDATQLTSRQVTNVTSSSPNKVAAAPKEDTATESDDEIQIIRSPRRKVVDLGDDDDTNEVENKVKENDQGEMTLAPFYSTTCPICLGQPSPLVVTKCGHTFCGSCLFAALSAPNTDPYLHAYAPGAAAKRDAAHNGELLDGLCPVCRTKLSGGWGKAARGLMWKVKRRRKARKDGVKLDQEIL